MERADMSAENREKRFQGKDVNVLSFAGMGAGWKTKCLGNRWDPPDKLFRREPSDTFTGEVQETSDGKGYGEKARKITPPSSLEGSQKIPESMQVMDKKGNGGQNDQNENFGRQWSWRR